MMNRAVLDKGYVILQDHMGSDLTAVNAARASFNKKSDVMSEKDISLLDFLTANKHLSPFRHQIVQLEVHAPLIVARQLWRYITGGASEGGHDEFLAYSECSFRYVSNELEFYVPAPDEWRAAPANKKQGSGGPVSDGLGEYATNALLACISRSLLYFDDLLAQGVAPEQARLVLPANALYTTFYLTMSLQGFAHLLKERLDDHAMWETRQYADAMYKLVLPIFPESLPRLMEAI